MASVDRIMFTKQSDYRTDRLEEPYYTMATGNYYVLRNNVDLNFSSDDKNIEISSKNFSLIKFSGNYIFNSNSTSFSFSQIMCIIKILVKTNAYLDRTLRIYGRYCGMYNGSINSIFKGDTLITLQTDFDVWDDVAFSDGIIYKSNVECPLQAISYINAYGDTAPLIIPANDMLISIEEIL